MIQKILFPGVCCPCRCCWGSAIFGALSRFVLRFRVFFCLSVLLLFFILTVILPEGKLLGQDTLPLAVLHTNETDVFLSSFVMMNKDSDELPSLAAGSVARSQNCEVAKFKKKKRTQSAFHSGLSWGNVLPIYVILICSTVFQPLSAQGEPEDRFKLSFNSDTMSCRSYGMSTGA